MFASPELTAYILVVTGIVGLVMGSFINCWAWRCTNGESVVSGRSHCTACGHDLGALDLIPVVSWLASGRKCRYCGEHVSARYPATEILCAAIFVAVVAVYGPTLEAVQLLAFSGVLLFLSLVDLDIRIIPNGCIVVALVVRMAYLAVAVFQGWLDVGQVLYYLASAFGVGIGLLVIVLIADHVFGRESMGFGDLKLYFVAGLYFGWQQCLFLIVVSCLIGLVVAFLAPLPEDSEAEGHDDGTASAASDGAVASDASVGSAASDVASDADAEGAPGADAEGEAAQDGPSQSALKRVIPFGPSIAAACIVTMFAGQSFVNWYFSLL